MAHYHVWFATKKRHWLLQGEVRTKTKELLATVATQHAIQLEASETMVDHVHLLVSVADDASLSSAMKLLKGRTAFELSHAFPDLRADASVGTIWQRGFNGRIVPKGEIDVVRRYIQTQDERLEKYERRFPTYAAGFNPRYDTSILVPGTFLVGRRSWERDSLTLPRPSLA